MTNWQTQANEFAQKHNLSRPASVYALDVLSELGEVAKELLLASDYGARTPQFREQIDGELGDVLYSLCLLATAVGVDLDDAFAATLAKYERRYREHGRLGSRSDSKTTE